MFARTRSIPSAACAWCFGLALLGGVAACSDEDPSAAADTGEVSGDTGADGAGQADSAADGGGEVAAQDGVGTDASGTDATTAEATDTGAADTDTGIDTGTADTDTGIDTGDATDGADATPDDTLVATDAAVIDVATPDSADAGSDTATVDITPDAGPSTGSAAVQVIDAAGLALAGATVQVDAQKITVNSAGVATLVGLAPGTAVASITAAGYAPAAKSLAIVAGAQTKAVVVLSKIGATQVVLLIAGTATKLSSGQVTLALPADQFVGADGKPYAGNVTVNVTSLDPSAGALGGAPGPLVGKATGAATVTPLSVAFLADVSFAAPDGTPLLMAAGKTATLSFILPAATAEQYTVGQSLGAWYFDVKTASWLQDGTGKITLDAATGKKAFTADVSHFTWWMGAEPISSTGCLKVTVSKDGAPAAGVQVQAQGFTYASTSMGLTGSDGSVCLEVKAGGGLVLTTQDAVLVQSGGPLTVTADSTVATCGAGAGCKAVAITVLGASVCSDAKTCDDKNPCTTDSCGPNGTCAYTLANGASCNDGFSCTVSDACTAGACKGAPKSCDDKNPCTTDFCDEEDSGCANKPVPGTPVCDDGDKCSAGDICQKGVCDGVDDSCSDGNPCTTDSCDDWETTGCIHKANAPDSKCDDGNLCSYEDKCSPQGACVGIVPESDCKTADPCKQGTCDPKAGCVFAPKAEGAGCVGDACLTGQVCQAGKCGGGKAVDCTDKDECTSDACVPGVGCSHPPKDCGDGDPCTKDTCSGPGTCAHEKGGAGAACEDGNPCTVGDSCDSGGKCTQGSKQKNCNDGSGCTSDSCDPKSGCVHAPANEGSACTGVTLCEIGECLGGNCAIKEDTCNGPCGDGVCEKFANEDAAKCPVDCLFTPFACLGKVGKCSDGLACTQGDHCEPTGLCIGQEAVGMCADGDACTQDKCGGPTMNAKGCWNPKMDCEDLNKCTDDKCGATGCVHTNNTAVCDDGDACTSGDACADAKCAPGAKADCDDKNACTTDSCDKATGCVHAKVADGGTCDDGIACSTGDACTAGVCKATAYSNAKCNDGNDCTNDFCTNKGCNHTNQMNGSPCSDGDACTGASDFCTNGACKAGGMPVTCSDGKACTTDSCDPKTGSCKYEATADGGSCADSNACNGNETCLAGVCKSGAPLNCDDANVCTDDACSGQYGCQHTGYSGIACGGLKDPCTDLQCQGGVCANLMNCNDDNACTTDSCDPKASGNPCKNTAIPNCP